MNHYKEFSIAGFAFKRDQYFAYIAWPLGEHILPIEVFLKALMRDIAWGFFYGTVNFDSVFGTVNHYGTVDIFAGIFNAGYKVAKKDYKMTVNTTEVEQLFKAMLEDWCPPAFDPFAAPAETDLACVEKIRGNNAYISRKRVTATRMVSMKEDAPLRSDATGHPVNRHFHDIVQDEPTIHATQGFEEQLAAFNLFAYLSRSDVTWNPSVCSVLENSLLCPTTEEHILPVIHGNDRVEWFIQISDEIVWNVEDKETGAPRARLTMRAGDIAAMPADIRHQGYSPKRSMLVVWENASADIVKLIASGKAPVTPVQF